MTEEQAEKPVADASAPAKKKVGWLGTILWMLGMIVAFNIVAGLLVYIFMK